MILSFSYCFLSLFWISVYGDYLSMTDGHIQFEEPENLTVLNGSQVILRCRVYLSDSYQIETVQWIKDGFGFTNESLEKMYHYRIMMTTSNMKGHYDLVIKSSNVTDDGEYACQASIKYRQDSSKVSIIRKKSVNIWLKIIVRPVEFRMKIRKRSQLFEMSVNKQSDNFLIDELKSYLPLVKEVWVSNNLVTSVACYTAASHPFARIEWKYNNQRLSQQPIIRNEPNQYEEIQSDDIKGEIQNVQSQSLNDFMYLSASFLKFSLKMETNNTKSLECLISNFQDFLMATPLIYRVAVKQLFIKDISIETIPKAKIQNLSHEDLVKFACYATISDNSRIFYKWSLVTNHFIKPLPEKSEIENIDLKILKEMNQVRLRCTVLVKPNVICRSTSATNSDANNAPDCSVLPVTIASKEIELSVSYPPSIQDLLSNITIATNLRKPIHLSCIATGNPKPKIFWFKIVPGKQEILLTRQSSFILQILTHNDYGEYQCHAVSYGFDTAIKRVMVGAPGPPKIYGNPKIFSEILKPIKLICTIKSIPVPNPKQIIWTKNYKIIDIPERIMTKVEWIPGGVIMSLIIVSVSYEDFGLYNCSVFTEYGSDYFTITLYQTENLSMLLCVAIAIVLAILAVIVCIIIYAIKLKNTRQKIKFLQIQTFSGYKSETQYKETFRNDQFYLSPYETLKSKSCRNALEPFIENVNKKENMLQAIYNL